MKVNRRNRTNLCFHGIGTPQRELEDGEAQYWISETLFSETMEMVAALPPATVGISFDDGNSSDLNVAMPMLTARGLMADFFPLASRLGEVGSVDAKGLNEMVSAGMTVGSHGMEHVSWRATRGAKLVDELDTARSIIGDAIGAAVRTVACPFGAYDRRVLHELRRRHYTRVFTSDRAYASDTAWLQSRFSVRSTDNVGVISEILGASGDSVARIASRARILAKSMR